MLRVFGRILCLIGAHKTKVEVVDNGSYGHIEGRRCCERPGCNWSARLF
jgi:hypothetical protein